MVDNEGLRFVDETVNAAMTLHLREQATGRFRLVDERSGRSFECGRHEGLVVLAFIAARDAEDLRERLQTSRGTVDDTQLVAIAKQLRSANVISDLAATRARRSFGAFTWWFTFRRSTVVRPWNAPLLLSLAVALLLVAIIATFTQRDEFGRVLALVGDV